MPSESRAQQKAMFAAEAGHSTLGIPKSVGHEFAEADRARGANPTSFPTHVGAHPMHSPVYGKDIHHAE